jgi:hypothetical protein
MSKYVKISVLSGTRDLISCSTAKDSFDKMKEYWRDRFSKVAPDRPDFIVLPEACDRFLDMTEKMKKEYSWFREKESPGFFNGLAAEFDAAVVYNTRNDNRNTTFACSRNGKLAGKYFKMFPTTTEMEQGIIPGDGAKAFSIDGISKAGFATCFDLNFDELRDEYTKLKPDIIFFCSMYHGGLVQKTWAYSTRSFFVSSICGRESGITAPNGRLLIKTTNYTDYCTASINLDCELIHLDFHWEKLDAMKKKYGSGVIIDDVGYLGSVLVYCEMEDKTIDDLIEEFEMTRLDDYFDHARDVRNSNLTD